MPRTRANPPRSRRRHPACHTPWHADPPLRVVMQRTITGENGGRIKCFLAHTSTTGVVTLTEYRLDSHRIRRETIQLPTAERRGT